MGYQNLQSLRKEHRMGEGCRQEKMGKWNKGITHERGRIFRDKRKERRGEQAGKDERKNKGKRPFLASNNDTIIGLCFLFSAD